MRCSHCVWLAALASCGDNDLPAITQAGSLEFAYCPGSGTLECATLVVPADWSDPDGDTISLPVVRGQARDPSRRIGVLTFNFGGPGEPTLAGIAGSYPSVPFATSVDLTQQFDFVAMDWRGVATTDPAISCLDATTSPALASQRFAPGSDGAWVDLFALVDAVGSGCSANAANAPLLAHQDTESAARDLDALRAGLGEAQLNYWGVSYGTRLGAMYAELFPDHARAIAIDSPVVPAPELQPFLQDQNASFEAEFSRFFAWCAAASATDCPFQTSDGSAASVAAAYDALLTAADANPVVANQLTLDGPTIDLVATNLMYFPQRDWPQLASALAALGSGDGGPLATIFVDDEIDYANDDNAFSSYENVCAQDMPLPAAISTPASYQAWAETQIAVSPHMGLQNAAAQAFAVAWPSTNPHVHAIAATTAPPLLITATRHDPATPYPGAAALQAALANDSYVITYEGDGHANAQFSPCLGDATAQFLIDPTTAPTIDDCPAIIPTASHRGERPSRRRRVRF